MIKKPKHNPSKVIAIDRVLKPPADLSVIASDAESNRMIITIGRERDDPDYAASADYRGTTGAGHAAEAPHGEEASAR